MTDTTADISLPRPIPYKTCPVFLPELGRHNRLSYKWHNNLTAVRMARNYQINPFANQFYLFVDVRIVTQEDFNPLFIKPLVGSAQRKDFVNRAEELFKSREKQFQKTSGEFRDLADRYNLNSENVVLSFERVDGEPEPTNEITVGERAVDTAQFVPGSVITKPSGQFRFKGGDPQDQNSWEQI